MVKAFVLTAPGEGSIQDVEAPSPQPGEVVVDVARVGVCGTDVEFFTGEMAYLHDGHAAYPMRLGHEWCGVVAAVGDGVDDPGSDGASPVTRCSAAALPPLPIRRSPSVRAPLEVGISGGKAGALAEQLAVPASSLRALPDAVDDAGRRHGGAGRKRACGPCMAAELQPTDRVLVWVRERSDCSWPSSPTPRGLRYTLSAGPIPRCHSLSRWG